MFTSKILKMYNNYKYKNVAAIYIYIYIYIHTHIHTHTQCYAALFNCVTQMY
jgi:hypothetical protein